MEENCWDNNYEEFNAATAFENDVKIFGNRDELLKWVRETGRTHGFVVVILRSDAGGNGRKTMLVFGCERSGKYKPYKKELTRNVTGTKKCGCPFRLRGIQVHTGDGWRLNVVCGYHNHDVAENLEGHAYACRLNADELSLLNDMTKNMLMETNNYVYWHRRHEDSHVVRDIVWTHPDAMKLLNIFHIMLIIDTTYKTNKYRLPLLEVVGVTSTELTFSVAFAYIEQEKSDNFMWVLEKIRSMILVPDVSPEVIVTDRDIALMNAVEKVFPVASHLLCQFHIAKNVKAKCKTLVSNTLEWQPIMDVWMSLMHSPTKADFEMNLAHFEQVCSTWGLFMTYVKHTWLMPHKEKFVDAWINKNMHLGTTTTNRVESAHSRLKNMLQDCRGDLCNCWDAMNNMITLQHTKIKASF
ncbi:MULE transposase domain [Sesbania bispinosa]|nr:MULE transposase domain [Sesbania bispinosa]